MSWMKHLRTHSGENETRILVQGLVGEAALFIRHWVHMYTQDMQSIAHTLFSMVSPLCEYGGDAANKNFSW